MDTLVTVVVVLAMIAIAAFVIHQLNARHRHQHLPPAHYEHGLAAFGEEPASGRSSRIAPESGAGERRQGGGAGSGEGSGSGSGPDPSSGSGSGSGG
ncbi:hypothetical protein ACFU8Q_11205 [Streptomyces sp. NPDC057543]|uniref:hypothetical protein n=1 Tax=Streptomyces sp. NPDC057543 TaxID=3346163 RepID=UPI003695E91B